MKTVEVVFDIPLDRTFDYIPGNLLPENLQGVRVLVPFGKQKRVGLILSVQEKETGVAEDYKSLVRVYDEFPLITGELLSIAQYMSKRYFSSFGQAVFSIIGSLPLRYRSGKKAEKSLFENRSVKNKGFYEKYLVFRNGDKKSEVYNRSISSVQAGSVLMLFPEVSQAEGFYKQISGLYKDRVVLFHGALKSKQKMENWLRMLNGQNLVVVGTRIAIFSPLQDIKTILIEHGHNSSYREQQTPKYDAVEVAKFRCEGLQIPLIIGEECLSVKEYYEVINKRALMEVYDSDTPSAVYTVGLKRTSVDKNIPFFSRETVSMLEEAVLKGGKVAVIHNRKGNSKILKCENCGNRFLCNTCGSERILTDDGKNLMCRFCKTIIPFKKKCPVCNSRKVGVRLYGIEKMFRMIKEQYPEMRVLKFTADIGAIEGEFDVLVGTGIIRKLLDAYPFLLVVFVSGESFLNIPDYRSEEKFFITINEVKASLRNPACRIIIQTRNSNLAVYKSLQENNPDVFYEKELAIRKQLGYPPFTEIIKVELKGRKKDVFQNKKDAIETYIHGKKIEIMYSGSAFPPVKKGKNIWKYLFRAPDGFDREGFKEMSQELDITVESNPEYI